MAKQARSENETVIRELGKLSSQFETLAQDVRVSHGRIASIERRMDELSGSVAVVLSRSEENKKKSVAWQMLTALFTES